MVGYNTVLKLSDFYEKSFRDDLCDVFAHLAAAHENFPSGNELGKAWEVTQAVRGLRDHGALKPDAEILGVAAGWEHTVFYLTNYVRRVFATDLYATDKNWQEADSAMLHDPARFTLPNFAWKPRRLVVQHMNALDLQYEDGSFSGVFSCGSIEHFGTLENVAKAASEMGRVLKPGGVMTLSTEFRIDGPEGIGIPGAILFTRDMVEEYIIRPSGLDLVDMLVTDIDDEVRKACYPLIEALEKGVRSRSICVSHLDYTWTSIALCLRKPI